jgi:hypothetical protein
MNHNTRCIAGADLRPFLVDLFELRSAVDMLVGPVVCAATVGGVYVIHCALVSSEACVRYVTVASISIC